MSLIATGQGLRKKSQQAAEAVSRLESQRNMQQDALDAQAKAQEMSLYGTAMGIGGAYGVNKALAAKDAAGAVAPKGISASTAAANAPQGASGLQYVGGGLKSLGPMGGTPPGAIETLSGAAETAKLAGETSAAVTKATGTTTAAGGAAGGSSGALSAIGTVAAPIAIALGAAFLLNKLFG